MIGDWRPTRRGLAKAFAGLAASVVVFPRGAAPKESTDQGIGGTGAAVSDERLDRGIGGTGVIGTIQRFGSIIVNDLRIAYPRKATVYIDGQIVKIADLKIGHVVRVEASGRKGRLSTARIDVASEVVGPVEHVSSTMLRVMGQSVLTVGVHDEMNWNIGERVAVSGLRRPDGIIVASLIEARSGGADRIAGPVTKAADGKMMIGDLTLVGVDPALVGHRAILDGDLTNDAFQVTGGGAERSLIGNHVRRLSVEAYVVRRADGLRFGSGLQVVDRKRTRFVSRPRLARAIVDLWVDQDGRFIVEDIRPENAKRSAGHGGNGTDGHGGSGAPGGPGGPGDPGGASGPGGPGPSSGPGGGGSSPHGGPGPR